jgi:hypothetical protein
MNHKIFFLFSTLCLLLFSYPAQAANITASLDRNPAMLDESFRLVLETDGSVDDDPDFSVLKKDFEILSQSQSTNMTFINGSLSRKGVWNLALIGKRTGTITIPSIPFGKDSSPALRITIKEATAKANPSAGGSEIYLETETDQKSAWVQSQVIYTLRLFSRLSMSNLRHGELTTSDSDAIIEQLGKATTYEAFRGGMRFAVRELRFAVYPQHSGELTFSPMVFEGRVNRNNSQSIFDQFMNTGSLKRLRSKSVSINIKAKPANIKTSDWLPASKLSLIEEWSEDVQQLKTGEPVTRTITVLADGPLAANLPDLKLADSQGLKQYPDKPILENRVTESGVASSKQIKVALIPTKAGNFKLPAISLAWWNTKTGKREVARLPEVVLNATGAANTVVNPPPVITPEQIDRAAEDRIKMIPTASDLLINAAYWPWLSLALAIGWLMTLIALLRKGKGKRAPKAQPKPTPALAPLEKSVYKYCSKNKAPQTKNALLEWAKARWPETTVASLMDITELTSAELGEQLQVLNTALYSPDHKQWNGTKLVKAFKTFRSEKIKKQDNSSNNALKPLYKAAS